MPCERIRLWVALIRCPASLRLSIASSRMVSSSTMTEVYGQTSSDHAIVSPPPTSTLGARSAATWHHAYNFWGPYRLWGGLRRARSSRTDYWYMQGRWLTVRDARKA